MPGKEEQKAQHEAVITKAMAHVWPSEVDFADAIACFYAFENMGQSLGSRHTQGTREGTEHRIFSQAWHWLVQESASENDEDGNELDITAEHKAWVKDAKKIIKTLKKHKLPFTMTNAEDVFKNPKKYEVAPKKSK